MCYLTRLGIVSLQVPYSFVSYTSVKLAEPHVNWRLLGGRLVWKPGEGFGPRLQKAESGMFAPACLGAKPSAPHLDAPGSPEKATWMPKGLANCGGTGS